MTTTQNHRERHPDYVRTILERAMKLIEENRLDSADVLLATLLDDPQAEGSMAYLRGVIAARKGEGDAAQAFFRIAIEADPRNADAHARLGSLLLDGRPVSAAAAFAAALTLDRRYADWHTGLAKAFASIGLREFAKSNLADALSLAPDHHEASVLAKLLEAGATPAEVEALPADDEASLRDALLMEASRRALDGEQSAAKRIYEYVLRRRPNDGHALCGLGAIERELGDLSRSEQLLLLAIAADPQLASASVALAQTYLAGDRRSEAHARFEAAVALEPKNAAVHAAYAVALQKMGESEKAIQHFFRAIAIDQRQSAEFYVSLGEALVALEKYDRAQIAFEHASALSPGVEGAKLGLARCARALERRR